MTAYVSNSDIHFVARETTDSTDRKHFGKMRAETLYLPRQADDARSSRRVGVAGMLNRDPQPRFRMPVLHIEG